MTRNDLWLKVKLGYLILLRRWFDHPTPSRTINRSWMTCSRISWSSTTHPSACASVRMHFARSTNNALLQTTLKISKRLLTSLILASSATTASLKRSWPRSSWEFNIFAGEASTNCGAPCPAGRALYCIQLYLICSYAYGVGHNVFVGNSANRQKHICIMIVTQRSADPYGQNANGMDVALW